MPEVDSTELARSIENFLAGRGGHFPSDERALYRSVRDGLRAETGLNLLVNVEFRDGYDKVLLWIVPSPEERLAWAAGGLVEKAVAVMDSQGYEPEDPQGMVEFRFKDESKHSVAGVFLRKRKG